MTDESQPMSPLPLSRRRFLTRAGVLGLGAAVGGPALLAACGSSKKSAATTTAAPATTATSAGSTTSGAPGTTAAATTTTADLSKLRGTTVSFANWQSYMDDGQKTLKEFTDATGIKVNYQEVINDNDDFLAKNQENLDKGKALGYDIVVLTDWMANKWIRNGWVQQISVPNVNNMQDALLAASFDPGRKHSMPWASGMTGLAYDPEKTGRELTSVNDIFDPKFKGRVAMLTEMRDTFGLVMLGMGIDPATCTTADAQKAADKIKQAKDSGQIRQFTGNDYTTGLTSGDLIVCFAWSGDIYQLQQDKPGLKFLIPQEGGNLWSDNMMVPTHAANPDGAFQVMNWYYDPKISAELNSSIHYISPVKGTQAEMEKIDPTSASNPLVNPPDELRAKLHIFKPLSEQEETEFNALFQPLIAG
jgi:spermidine/putrescine transport system substrate-binding protein